MESSEEAGLDLFRIGPTTTYGRVVALNVLSCNYFRELLALIRSRAINRVVQIEKLLAWLVAVARKWFNPRNPNFLLGSILVAALALRRYRMGSLKAEINYRRTFWSNLMRTALTYDEWAHAATMLDKYNGRKQDSDLYDEDLVRAKLEELQHRRLEGGVEEIAFHLRTDLVRNLGNMCNPELHKGRLQTPRLIQEYINEVRYHLRAVVETDSEEFPVEEKLAFIHETRHAFGRTALLLSGGAALGAFHLGVVRTLIEHKLLPRVIAGASVGSIICSFCATRTWTELQSFFDDPMPPMAFFENMGSIVATAHRLFTRGAIQEIGLLQRKMRQLIGDLTFQEAYDLSGRVLGITVSSMRKHEPPRLLNYLTSPHVVIWSAVTASCAFPGLFEAQELMAKDRRGRLVPYHMPTQVGPEKIASLQKRHWRDGSLDCDLPIKELKEQFNVNHYIVSQANPHIAPLLRIKEAFRVWGGSTAAKLAHLAEMEVKHRCNQALEMGFRLWGIPKLFAQPWEGDVTIVMPATFAQFAKLIANPTPSELRKAVMQGRRCTWARLSAIQANCGIELMLDECVSELNRRLKVARDREERHAEGSRSGRFTLGTKRIPSWNCMARESSWGSLEEDGTHELSNGPWAGPIHGHRRMRSAKAYHDGSDSDSGTDNHESVTQLWTKAGGPLMRTASAARLALLGLHGGDEYGEGSEHGEGSRHGPKGEERGDPAETPGSPLQRVSRGSSGSYLDSRQSSFRKSMWDRVTSPASPSSPQTAPPLDSNLHLDDHDESDAEDRSYGLAMRSGLRRSPRSSTDRLDTLGSQADREGDQLRHRSLSMPDDGGLMAGTGDGDDDTVRGGRKLGCLLKSGWCVNEDNGSKTCGCPQKQHLATGREPNGDPATVSSGSMYEDHTHSLGEGVPQGGGTPRRRHLVHTKSQPPIRGSGMVASSSSFELSQGPDSSRAWDSPRPIGSRMASYAPGAYSSGNGEGAELGLRDMLDRKLQNGRGHDSAGRGEGSLSESAKVDPFGSFVSRSSSQADDREPNSVTP